MCKPIEGAMKENPKLRIMHVHIPKTGGAANRQAITVVLVLAPAPGSNFLSLIILPFLLQSFVLMHSYKPIQKIEKSKIKSG
jgi:hypothetical protein